MTRGSSLYQERFDTSAARVRASCACELAVACPGVARAGELGVQRLHRASHRTR